MAFDVLVFAVLYLFGMVFFGHFEEQTHKLRRVLKIVMLLGVTALISAAVGRPWSLVWSVGIFAVGLVFHFQWALRHGIHPITAEPRDKYYALRGWSKSA